VDEEELGSAAFFGSASGILYVLCMRVGAGEYKVEGREVEEWGIDLTLKLVFPHGRKRCEGGLEIEMDSCKSAGGRVPQYCSELSHAVALGFLYWCWGSVDKFHLEPWSTIKSLKVGFWQFVGTCKVQKQCYCFIRPMGL